MCNALNATPAPNDALEKAMECVLFFYGFDSGMRAADAGLKFCPPAGSKLGDMIDLYRRASAANPGWMKRDAGEFFASALSTNWPCN